METTTQTAANDNASKPAHLRFFWNGIKVGGGSLQPASYYYQPIDRYNAEASIGIRYGSHCGRFSPEVSTVFAVKNGTDSMTDYFESDSIKVPTTHPLFATVAAALDASLCHTIRRATKLGRTKWASEVAQDLAELRATGLYLAAA